MFGSDIHRLATHYHVRLYSNFVFISRVVRHQDSYTLSDNYKDINRHINAIQNKEQNNRNKFSSFEMIFEAIITHFGIHTAPYVTVF